MRPRLLLDCLLRSSRCGRCETIRHCKWADEVIPEAPWILSPEFLEKHKIDYVAHDEDPYAAPGHDDVYTEVKGEGSFKDPRSPSLLTATNRQILANKAHCWSLHHRPRLSNGFTIPIRTFQFQAEKRWERRTELERFINIIGIPPVLDCHRGGGGYGFCFGQTCEPHHPSVLVFLIPSVDKYYKYYNHLVSVGHTHT